MSTADWFTITTYVPLSYLEHQYDNESNSTTIIIISNKLEHYIAWYVCNISAISLSVLSKTPEYNALIYWFEY